MEKINEKINENDKKEIYIEAIIEKCEKLKIKKSLLIIYYH